MNKIKRYEIVFPFTGDGENKLVQHIESKNTWAEDISDTSQWFKDEHKNLFTEQEIKAIDERYWAFAEEVTSND